MNNLGCMSHACSLLIKDLAKHLSWVSVSTGLLAAG
jgi:hypothetical protein